LSADRGYGLILDFGFWILDFGLKLVLYVDTLDSEMEKLPPERRARIEARTKELLKQANMIRLLREELGYSQSDLAERLGVQQSTVSKLENAPESLTLGKLANVVTALGGEWKIVLKFPTTEEIELSSTDTTSAIDNSNF
jgi:DNA-binding XRE family transcriptional regulator